MKERNGDGGAKTYFKSSQGRRDGWKGEWGNGGRGR